MSDLISRQAAIDAISGMFLNIAYSEKNVAWSMALEKIRRLPSAQPERAKGKWEYVGLVGEILFPYPMCSVCKKTSAPFIEPKFCPNCGADMREDGDGND